MRYGAEKVRRHLEQKESCMGRWPKSRTFGVNHREP